MKESILFWPVRLEGNTLYILDETKVPKKVSYIKASGYRQAIDAVVSMKTRAFGQFLTVCYSFILETKKAKGRDVSVLMEHLKHVAEAFNNSRPTFPFAEVTGMALGIAKKVHNSPDLSSDFIRAMEGMLEGIRKQRYDRARRAAGLLKDGDSVLTHCHVSGEMSMIGEFCRMQGKLVRFFATETRPYFQGARLTAWELKEEGFDVTLVPDNAVAKLMSDKKVDRVIVGSDRSAKNGDFANKIGTYQIAVLAKEFGVPFYALTQPSDKISKGEDIPIEIRNPNELLTYLKKKIVSGVVSGFYPGFDVVPHELITKAIAIDVH